MNTNIKAIALKIQKYLDNKYQHDCLFCKNYHTAYGRCKGQELEICGNYVDIDKISLWERVIKFIGRMLWQDIRIIIKGIG